MAGKLREEYAATGAKYLRVSAFNVVFGQSLLAFTNAVLGWSATASNVFAVCVSAIPAYFLSRYWVWQKSGKNHFWKEVVPFWALALAGLLLSTWAVGRVEGYYPDLTPVVMFTNFSAFGVIWVGKFFILDKILFKDELLTDDPLDAFVDEALHGENQG